MGHSRTWSRSTGQGDSLSSLMPDRLPRRFCRFSWIVHRPSRPEAWGHAAPDVNSSRTVEPRSPQHSTIFLSHLVSRVVVIQLPDVRGAGLAPQGDDPLFSLGL